MGTCWRGAGPREGGRGLVVLTEDKIADGGEGGVRLRRFHLEDGLGTPEEEEEDEEEDEEEERVKGPWPSEKLEMMAQTSSSRPEERRVGTECRSRWSP